MCIRVVVLVLRCGCGCWSVVMFGGGLSVLLSCCGFVNVMCVVGWGWSSVIICSVVVCWLIWW